MKVFIAFSVLVAATSRAATLRRDAAASLEGYQAFRVDTGESRDDVLQSLSALSYDQWNDDVSQHIDFDIAPDQVDKLKKLNLDLTQLHSNLGAVVKEEKSWKPYPGKKGGKDSLPPDSWFDSYHPYADHLKFLNDLQSAFPWNSRRFSSGTSYEGRELPGIHLWGRGRPGRKQAIIFHATVHAREWISSMVVEYIAYNLVSGYRSRDRLVQGFLDTYDFYIIPFVNPDGFIYTQTVNRLWRKNRQPPPPDFANRTCIGIDVNRNWPYMWDYGQQSGSSDDPCAETYHGAAPGDSPENQGMTAFIDKVAAQQGLKLYIDWHSYAQAILSPYGYTCTATPNSEEQVSLAGGIAATIEAIRPGNWTYGPICTTLYPADGSSVDYTYDVAGAEFAYAFELRGSWPGDPNAYGFLLPPQYIRPSAEEIWAGMKYLFANM